MGWTIFLKIPSSEETLTSSLASPSFCESGAYSCYFNPMDFN
jgi:hypothetical protein